MGGHGLDDGREKDAQQRRAFDCFTGSALAITGSLRNHSRREEALAAGQ